MPRTVLHLDLDAFFASVEQRDKPSLRGKPVVVGGIGGRGVVATASYEARALGVHSALSTAIARRRAPHAAYLAGRFEAYRESSRLVMDLLSSLSPLVEPLSLDEAYVDLSHTEWALADPELRRELAEELRTQVSRRTQGLTASVGIGSSKFIAKLASEAAKPDGCMVIAPGEEIGLITPMKVSAIPGVGPATTERLGRLGIVTVADLQHASVSELTRELGQAVGASLHELAFARDDRRVQPVREAKSISVEDTFATDLTDRGELEAIVVRDAATVARRLNRKQMFARTIGLKVRFADFTTWSRSRTLDGATDSAERIGRIAVDLLHHVDLAPGVRLIGVGVSNFTDSAQEELFWEDDGGRDELPSTMPVPVMRRRLGAAEAWVPGMDVVHDDHGRGWVWGAGHGVVTVRFETRHTGPGPVRSLSAEDVRLKAADPLWLEPPTPGGDGEMLNGPDEVTEPDRSMI